MKENYEDLLGFTSGNGSKSASGLPRCFHSHPALPIGDFFVYGGSCSNPVVLDADIYIGFDYSMTFSKGHWPWEQKTTEVYFNITDMQAPKDPGDFKKLVAWAAGQIKAGKKLHAGCIGGHGRTGTFLAALVTFMTGELDSITYVRKHYCKKAVESSVQINFLNKHFGITKIEASKAHVSTSSWGGYGYGGTKSTSATPKSGGLNSNPKPFSGKPKSGKIITPVSSRTDIWKVV